ncbi:MAG: hypothetical protein AB7R69_06605 [Candidatus Babeliales bacterium]
MKTKDWFLALVEACAWYGFIYTILYSIKHDVNLYASTFVIIVFMYVASIACPVVRHLQAWKDLWKEK